MELKRRPRIQTCHVVSNSALRSLSTKQFSGYACKTVIKHNNLIANQSIYPSRPLPWRCVCQCAAENSGGLHGLLACVTVAVAVSRCLLVRPSAINLSPRVLSRLADAPARRQTGALLIRISAETDRQPCRLRPVGSVRQSAVVANAAIGDAQCYNGLDQFGHRFVSNCRTDLAAAGCIRSTTTSSL